MAIYKANANGVTHKDLIIGSQKHKAVYAGDKLIWEKNNSGTFVFTYSGSIHFKFKGIINVDWGNGSKGTYTSKTGEYIGNQSNSICTAVISGDLQYISFMNLVNPNKPVWNDLLTVETPFPKSMKEQTSFFKCFIGCPSLYSIPSGLFKNCSNAVDFEACFNGCSLETVPGDIFSSCTKAEIFDSCFGGFKSPQKMKEVPENLFQNCLNAKNFEACFSYQEVAIFPTNLFSGCPNVINFKQTLRGNSYYIKSAPKLWLTHPNADGTECYSGDFGLPWYDEIPSTWR